MNDSAQGVDVAVIGRGVIGSAAARHLAEGGHSVAQIGPDEPRMGLGPKAGPGDRPPPPSPSESRGGMLGT